jgi:hypothetical protein
MKAFEISDFQEDEIDVMRTRPHQNAMLHAPVVGEIAIRQAHRLAAMISYSQIVVVNDFG